MIKHIVPQDSYNHIEDLACGCNPTIVLGEGEEMYIHKIMDIDIILECFERLDNKIFYEQNTNK